MWMGGIEEEDGRNRLLEGFAPPWQDQQEVAIPA
jgi:hypothetical protein